MRRDKENMEVGGRAGGKFKDITSNVLGGFGRGAHFCGERCTQRHASGRGDGSQVIPGGAMGGERIIGGVSNVVAWCARYSE